MTGLTDDERAELAALRERVRALEQERAEQFALTNKAIAAAEERAYWLDRWHLDLNALMRRPGAAEFRAAIRLLRVVIRTVRRAKRRIIG